MLKTLWGFVVCSRYLNNNTVETWYNKIFWDKDILFVTAGILLYQLSVNNTKHIVAGATKPRISKMLNVQENQKTWRL